MNSVNCCRTCLTTNDLNLIFHKPNKSDNYSHILKLTTGLEIHINDDLPQKMCKTCINIINEHIEFLHQCYKSQLSLLNRIHNEPNIEKSRKIRNTNRHKVINNEEEIQNIFKCNESDFDDKSNNYCNNNDASSSNEYLGMLESTVEDLLKKHREIKLIDYVPRKKVKIVHEEKEEVITPKMNDDVKKDIGPIECKYCKKILKTKNSLSSHYKIHFGPNIVCEHCGKKFMSKQRLLMHCKSKHGYEKTDKCSYCDYKGSNAELVKIHERTHTGERPYVCSRCGASFHRRSTYLQHTPIHLTEKTVPCPDCPALFKSVTLMKIHRSRHKRKAKRDNMRHSVNNHIKTIDAPS